MREDRFIIDYGLKGYSPSKKGRHGVGVPRGCDGGWARGQRKRNSTAAFSFSLFIQSVTPAHRIVSFTFRTGL